MWIFIGCVLWCLTVMSDQWYEWLLLTGRVWVSSWKGITSTCRFPYLGPFPVHHRNQTRSPSSQLRLFYCAVFNREVSGSLSKINIRKKKKRELRSLFAVKRKGPSNWWPTGCTFGGLNSGI